MKTKESKVFMAHSNLPVSKLLDKLHQVTAKEFDDAKKSRVFQYYGKIDHREFDIRNVKYCHYSTGPSIQGELDDITDNNTLLKINIDTDGHSSYSNTILTLTILIIGVAATLFSLSAEVDKFIVLSVFGVMAIFVSLYVMMIKIILKSTKKNELKKFLEITESKLI